MSILKNKNFAFSTLSAGILSTDTSLVVLSSEGARFPSTGYFICALWGSAYPSPGLDPNREIIKMTLTSGDTFAIERAQEGTTARGWSSGASVALVLSAGKVTELETLTQNSLLSFGIATGTNAYTAVLDPAITSYVSGAAYNIKFVNASTGACTLGLNALASKKLFDFMDGVLTQSVSGSLVGNHYSTVFYDSSLDGGAGGFILANTKIVHPSTFPAGTALMFPQAAAPTGWTLDSSWSTPRSIVIANSYGTGGADSATTFTTGVGVAAHTSHLHSGPWHDHPVTVYGYSISNYEMPYHAHNQTGWVDNNILPCQVGGGLPGAGTPRGGTISTSYTGSGAAHPHSGSVGGGGNGNTGYGGPTTHSVTQSTYSPRYMTVIRATKN